MSEPSMADKVKEQRDFSCVCVCVCVCAIRRRAHTYTPLTSQWIMLTVCSAGQHVDAVRSHYTATHILESAPCVKACATVWSKSAL